MVDILGLSSGLEETAGSSPLPLVWSAATLGKGGLAGPRLGNHVSTVCCCPFRNAVTPNDRLQVHTWDLLEGILLALEKKVLFPLKIKRNRGHQKQKTKKTRVDCSYACHP